MTAGPTHVELHSSAPAVNDALARRRGAHDGAFAAMEHADGLALVHIPVWSTAAQRLGPLLHAVAAIRAGRPTRVELGLSATAPPAPAAMPPDAQGIRAIVDAAVALGATLGLTVATDASLPRCAGGVGRPSLRGASSLSGCDGCVERELCSGPPDWYVARHSDRSVQPQARLTRNASGIDWEALYADLGAAEALGRAGAEAVAKALWVPFRDDDPEPLADVTADPAEAIAQALKAHGLSRAEELYFRAAIKPVLYLTPTFDEVDALIAQYADFALDAVDPRTSPTAAGVAPTRVHVFVSRDAALARRCGDIYRGGDPTGQAQEMGELMGYPPCCARAFAARADNSDDAENVVRLAELAADGPLHACLNVGLAHLVPFFPCSLACDDAARFGLAALGALFPDDPGGREHLMRSLSRPTLFFDRHRVVAFDGFVERGEVVSSGGAAYARVSAGPHAAARHAAFLRATASLTAGPARLHLDRQHWTIERESGTLRFDRPAGAPGVLFPFGRRS
ncbi:MAG: DUF483 domain-containing protein [Myxococcales bacterium]|nr:DUF483 domain-containing protein [Myxococcales bacterium]MCB9532142.1 DUF483 domain-containing protein [Myxococcales bacterium]